MHKYVCTAGTLHRVLYTTFKFGRQLCPSCPSTPAWSETSPSPTRPLAPCLRFLPTIPPLRLHVLIGSCKDSRSDPPHTRSPAWVRLHIRPGFGHIRPDVKAARKLSHIPSRSSPSHPPPPTGFPPQLSPLIPHLPHRQATQSGRAGIPSAVRSGKLMCLYAVRACLDACVRAASCRAPLAPAALARGASVRARVRFRARRLSLFLALALSPPLSLRV